jgi:pyruvate dehydrogenase E1 component alpha subunit
VIAVRHVVEQALERARNGDGPTLIEVMTYRLSDHTTADDASRYREQKEVDEAWQLEPMIRTRKYLARIGAWDDKKEKAWLKECGRQVDEAVEEYLNTPKNTPESMFDFMYAELPEALEEQREIAAHYFGKGGH